MKEDFSDYADIIDLPHHVSKSRPRMSMNMRAAQFAPFAALNGHNDAIKDTATAYQKERENDYYVDEC